MIIHRVLLTLIATSLPLAVPPIALSQAVERDHAVYVEQTKYPVLKEMKETNETLRKTAQEKTDKILEEIKKTRKEKKDTRPEFRPEISAIDAPVGPEVFDQAWHFPPTPQYLTGTCWSFSVTSFIESEVARRHGDHIKLSEMWTAYWEYIEKAKAYIETRGESVFEQGSESNAFQHIFKTYGIVPRAAYEGVLAADGRFNHELMFGQMKAFLEWCRERNIWNEELIIGSLRQILDTWMGPPPKSFSWQGVHYTPHEFLSKVVKINPDDYLSLMSTSSLPFYTRGEFEVPDNWWHDKSYINLPLDEWYAIVLKALDSGATLTLGGDVSEPGLYGRYDIAFVPSFDIPTSMIDQDAREMRICNGTTTDDHGVHLVGHLRHAGHDWFLIKDSNRSSRAGRFKGYYMYRDDYLRLKMLTVGLHKDFVGDLLGRVAPRP